jgi:hypothetical protein
MKPEFPSGVTKITNGVTKKKIHNLKFLILSLSSDIKFLFVILTGESKSFVPRRWCQDVVSQVLIEVVAIRNVRKPFQTKL